MDDTLFLASTVLPIAGEPISDGAVLVSGSGITDVGAAGDLKKKHSGIPTRELGDGILLPALVNAHTHLELGWIREYIAPFSTFADWITEIIKAKRNNPDIGEELKRSVAAGITELIASGVGTVGEISSFEGADREILKSSGLRTVLFRELFDSDGDSLDGESFERSKLFEERPFPHAPYSCSPEFLNQAAALSRNERIPIGIHLAESEEEVKLLRGEPNGFEEKVYPLIEREAYPTKASPSPYRFMQGLGFFDSNRATLVHMVHVSDAEVDDAARREIGVVLCPRSNFFLRVGAPPIKKLSELKRLGIGTDGLSSNHDLDILEELRFAHLLSSTALESDAARFCVYLATLGGARALFLEDKIGSIEPGKDADLLFLAPQFPSSDPYLSVISSRTEDVRLLIVAGRPVHSTLKERPGATNKTA